MKEQDSQLNFIFYQFIALTTTSLTLGDRVSSLDLTLSSKLKPSSDGWFSSQQLTMKSVASSMSCFHCFIIFFTPYFFFGENYEKKELENIEKRR